MRIIALVLSFVFCFLLSGCDLFITDTAELLMPPTLSGELRPIAEAINKSVQGPYILKYPSSGNYRSAVVQEDIDADGIFEAFAFYSMGAGEELTMQINAIVKKENVWESVGEQKIVAGGVDKIEFCDLDNDGVKEILVGWQIYGTSEMQLAVYSLKENTLIQRMLKKYTHFITCDLDEDDVNEILVIESATSEATNLASLFILTDDTVTELSKAQLDITSKTIGDPVLSTLSNGRPAVYIDEVKGVGAITEVLFMEKGVLVNPLLDSETGETNLTLRSVSFSIKDINNDGLIEIPVQVNVPSVAKSEVNEKLYLTNWNSFNGEFLTVQTTMMINTNDGYYFTIPQKWIDKIAILKDTDSRLREIYRYNPEDETVGESLIYIKAVKKQDWEDGKYNTEGIEEIMNDGQTSFICKISDEAKKDGINIEIIRQAFKLIGE